MDDDGLPTRESGEWIKRKHYFLDRYCDLFTRSMRGKWRRLYLDVMAGPGRCQIRPSGEIAAGSPFIALERDFDEYRFFEAHPPSADALRQRVFRHPKAALATVTEADWRVAVTSPSFTLPQGTLTLAFVDPTGILQVPWGAVRALAQSSTHIDMMFTIQHAMGINLNAHQYLASTSDE